MAQKHPNILNVADADVRAMEKGKRFAFKLKRLGRATGAKGIGCNWMEVPVGKTAFPKHFHTANEEAIYILEGQGEMSIGKDTVAVVAGDYITFPVGAEHAHGLTATGDRPLRYLCFSTLLPAEVVGYPDSKKIGCMYWPSGSETPLIRSIFKDDGGIDYYEGEKID